MQFGDSKENINDKKFPYFSKCTCTIIHSIHNYSFVQMKDTYTHRASSLHGRTLSLPHTFTEDDESFLVPGTVCSTGGAHSHGLTPSSPLWKVCSLIEHDDICDPIPVGQTQVIQLGASWHSHAQF